MIVLKADKSGEAPDVDALLKELGNHAKAIPYYAVFKPDEDPIHFNGVFGSPNHFLNHVGPGTDASVREHLISNNPKQNATVENSSSDDFETLESQAPPAGRP